MEYAFSRRFFAFAGLPRAHGARGRIFNTYTSWVDPTIGHTHIVGSAAAGWQLSET